MKAFTHEAFREIERELTTPLFFGVPLGATLNDTLLIEFFNNNFSWSWKSRWEFRLLKAKYWLAPRRMKNPAESLPRGRILVTCLFASPRITELMLPVVQELKNDPCAVLCGSPDVAPMIPAGVPCRTWDTVLSYAVQDWRAEYRRCRDQWDARLKTLSRKFDLPKGSFERLALQLMLSSQSVAGCVAFLKAAMPSIIVTEFDRNRKWSCLVLAARLLGIPTITLVHGVMSGMALGYSPVLADKIVCWGDFDRQKLLAAGEPPGKIVVGGCPRLSRDLPVTPRQGRLKLQLAPDRPVVLFATAPEQQRLALAEAFCSAVNMLEGVSGVVRLHPSEKEATYGKVMQRHPHIKFCDSSVASLDESLAAADAVVVHISAVGSDALIKRRPAVVLDFETQPSGPSGDLIRHAGCPHARTPAELADILRRVLCDEPFRRELEPAAERYVENFCSAYGKQSARLIAGIVRQTIKETKTRIIPDRANADI